MNRIDIHAKEHYGCAVDLSIAETLNALESVECRMIGCGSYSEVQILHHGEWLSLGRVDLFDQVATGICYAHDEDAKKIVEFYVKRKVQFGARVRGGSFLVVDSVTDG